MVPIALSWQSERCDADRRWNPQPLLPKHSSATQRVCHFPRLRGRTQLKALKPLINTAYSLPLHGEHQGRVRSGLGSFFRRRLRQSSLLAKGHSCLRATAGQYPRPSVLFGEEDGCLPSRKSIIKSSASNGYDHDFRLSRGRSVHVLNRERG